MIIPLYMKSNWRNSKKFRTDLLQEGRRFMFELSIWYLECLTYHSDIKYILNFKRITLEVYEVGRM